MTPGDPMHGEDLAAMRERISFVQDRYPNDCISPNLITSPGLEEYPGFGGTGFFAKWESQAYYITARHCLTKQKDVDVGQLAARLHVPYSLSCSTHTTKDYVQFSEVLLLKHNSDEIPGAFVDVLVFPISRSENAAHYDNLLARAVKLPPTGQWLDEFIQHPVARNDYERGKGIRVTAIGYPVDGTASAIEYTENQPAEIVTQFAKLSGYLSKGAGPDRYMLSEVSWEGDMNGFSGSPVFVGFRHNGTPNYALAGMLVSGSSKKAHFIKISIINLSVQQDRC